MLKVLAAAALATTLMTGLASAAEKKVNLAYVEWSDAVVATNLLAETLKKEGYNVTLTPLPAAAMWQAVATGEADAMVAAWLPATHAAYYAKLKDKVDLVGPNVSGAKIGWAVPAYVDLTSVEDLKTKGAEVGNKVIGIDPGAGLMQASEKAIKDYGLTNINLVDGSDATMTAALKDAIDRKQPIVVTTWTPHWMFGRWDLKYLADPKGSFGGEETVNTVARKGLDKDMPEVYKVLKNFKLSLDDEQKMMLQNEEKGANPAANAKAWVAANPDKVAAWTK
ncbi:glycine/betaine ABC transporter substrate-binding protein [Aureimonas ureilytica]|uniref:Glycine/betaine ABC transporter substrate-binding protein n=1 Tax=Aureimonas ureilytica TaxID=401562 RepID=A0A175R9R6_9HYPH|nr:glycine betaine ABC transporter substrate-binding protein [Aureimonas ureilytica]KTQ95293.1 glycine/betaine ABC transporter substrate-binding protein [Aureimonas ureilytica]